VAALAARRHGIVTWAQLRRIGLGEGAIRRRIRAGWLHVKYRGVYAVGHPTLTLHGRFLAAVVAFGDQAVLSHRSAAVLWGLVPERGPRIDVTVPGTGGRTRRGAVVCHRSPLSEADATALHGIPVTNPARTLADLAAVVSDREFERALDEAAYLRLDLSGLQPRQGRRGGARIRRVLANHRAGTTRTRSEMEERMLALCNRFALPRPLCNLEVEGHTVDFVWPQSRLIVETDGWQAHGTRRAFETDRRRDAHLVANGWRPVRLTWKRLMSEPEEVVEQLRGMLT
jgi:very-short-patch-repair endonuclease